MENYVFKNRKTMNVSLDNGVYYIEVAIKQSFLEGIEEYSFVLTNRYNEDDIVNLNFVKKNQTDDYYLFEITVPFCTNINRFIDGEMWDLHILRKIEDNTESKSRIRTRDRQLNFHTIVQEDKEKMFYPFATKKGNLSFYANDYKLFSMFDELNLQKDGMLQFSGYFNYPPLFQLKGFKFGQVSLLIRNNLTEDERIVPIKSVDRDDLVEKYAGSNLPKNIGFKGEINLLDEIDFDQSKYFMFYIVLDYQINGSQEQLTSLRMKCSSLENLPSKSILKVKQKRVQVKIKATKISKYLSLSVSRYNFKTEVVKGLRKRWVKTRRSKRLRKWYKSAFAIISLIIPANKKLAVFESYHGKQYSDSPRAIYEYMKEHYPEYKLVWSVDRASMNYFAQKDVEYVRRFSIRWLLIMTRAKYWINNVRFPLWIPKPKHTIYVQTWHGTPLKRLAMDMDEVHMPGTNTNKYKKNFLREASNWDYLVSPNAYSTEIFERAFQFDRNMIESGYPRNDFLHNSNNEETINELKSKFNLPLDKKLILYAPTWRDNQFYRKGKYKFNLELDLARMQEELGDSYIVIMRMHYLVAQNMDLTDFEGFAYDFSHLEDIRELYLISDILVTDYSSVFFDYANLRRPMIFFTYDIEDYRDNLRGFYFDFEEKAPGLLTKTTEELIEEVKNIERKQFQLSERFEEFYQKFCYLECGQSAKRVVDEVFLKKTIPVKKVVSNEDYE
ncbi:CDP-glycerol glycerophosphotransferase family protein [Peribacillus butanolivorans]|uniref:CDP-glycerol glycerophosphotransferase family protein n=1 Tax=Peribacillus butanolivorans TaxID=421767 RepID=UPI00367294BD